jgi:hypothetical protein
MCNIACRRVGVMFPLFILPSEGKTEALTACEEPSLAQKQVH